MDEEKLIQISLQIPPSALDSLSRLAEQLRLLTETANMQAASAGRAAEAEFMESDFFDPARFQALRQVMDAPEVIPPENPPVEDAAAVSSVIQEISPAAESAGENAREADSGPPPDRKELFSAEIPHDRRAEAIPAVRADVSEPIPDAQGITHEAGQTLPDADRAEMAADSWEPAPDTVQGETSGAMETPLGAGVVIHAQPDMPQSRWSGVTEELVIPGPAPLTAEAVSLAFERDGRRYDNGFPLY